MPTTSPRTASVMSTVVSRDGTTIAFEQLGSGPAVILVSSALADRSDASKLATLLARHHTVINYDRRGRGSSGDAAGYAVEREIEDIAALIEHVGGSASLFGSSSGAVLALRAAAAGIGVRRLALYEPPFVVDRDSDFGPPPGFADRIDSLLAEGRRSAAVKHFMTEAQAMPSIMVTVLRLLPGVWSKLAAMAHTLPYDIAVMGDTQEGKPLDAAQWSTVAAPTLVLTGGRSGTGFQHAARELAAVLPSAEHRSLAGLNHGAVAMAPKKLAPALLDFLRA